MGLVDNSRKPPGQQQVPQQLTQRVAGLRGAPAESVNLALLRSSLWVSVGDKRKSLFREGGGMAWWPRSWPGNPMTTGSYITKKSLVSTTPVPGEVRISPKACSAIGQWRLQEADGAVVLGPVMNDVARWVSQAASLAADICAHTRLAPILVWVPGASEETADLATAVIRHRLDGVSGVCRTDKMPPPPGEFTPDASRWRVDSWLLIHRGVTMPPQLAVNADVSVQWAGIIVLDAEKIDALAIEEQMVKSAAPRALVTTRLQRGDDSAQVLRWTFSVSTRAHIDGGAESPNPWWTTAEEVEKASRPKAPPPVAPPVPVPVVAKAAPAAVVAPKPATPALKANPQGWQGKKP